MTPVWHHGRSDFACPSCVNGNHAACRIEFCTCTCPDPPERSVTPDLVPVRVAAQRLGIGESTYRRAAANGQVPPVVHIRGVARVGVRALDQYIEGLTLASSSTARPSAGAAAVGDDGGVGPSQHNGEQTPDPSTHNQTEVPR